MKLYNVPANSRVRILGEVKTPPASYGVDTGEVINFKHIDGMYSYCKRDNGDIVHLAAWTEVEIVK